MMSHEERIRAYEIDTDFLEISGMEYLEMLFNRSEIAKIEDELSVAQKARLAQADQRLIRDAHLFYKAIQSIADLKSWRDQDNVPPDHWWWYLDVLAAAPVADVLLFLIDGDSVFIRPKPASFTRKLHGLYKDIWPADTEQWLAEERASWE